MCPPPATVEAIVDPSLLGCERVDAGARTVLIRVTLALGDLRPSLAARAKLVSDDRGDELRSDVLPVPLRETAVVTLGFAVPATARPLGVELGNRALVLALSGGRPPGPAQPPDPATGEVPGEALADVQRRLRATQARLAASREACVLIVQARDAALRGMARAEAAAHDASALAAALERREPEDRRRLRRGSRMAAVAVTCVLGPASLLAILAWPARDGDTDHGVGGVAAASASPVDARITVAPAADPLAARLQIPADYLARYRQAAARYGLDWAFLAAVGAIESGHGRSGVPGILSGANPQGATGPAQFLPGTWERFGLDGDGDGDRDPRDPADAIPAMASYLRASGAPQDWRRALRSYNHSDAYVGAVESLATRLRSTGS